MPMVMVATGAISLQAGDFTAAKGDDEFLTTGRPLREVGSTPQISLSDLSPGSSREEEVLDLLRRRISEAAAHCSTAAVLREALELLENNGDDDLNSDGVAEQMALIDPILPVMQTLTELSGAPGIFGLDIGGTLAKMVHMQPAGRDWTLARRFGETGEHHEDLRFELSFGGSIHRVCFLSGTSSALERVLREHSNGGTEHSAASPRRVVAAGGGALRLASLLLDTMGIEMVPFKEMESLVTGLAFLHAYGPPGEVFEVDPESGAEQPTRWPTPLFPCILVNIGSGVSMLRIDRAKPGGGGNTFIRMGGTASGGATFLGLARILTSARTFQEALALAARGDSSRVNKLVSDIYGDDGCNNLGLPANLTAVHFGKLVSLPPPVMSHVDEEDLAAALLVMVTQASTVLARAFCRPPLVNEGLPNHRSATRLTPGTAGCRARSVEDKRGGISTAPPTPQQAVLLGPAAARQQLPVFFVGGFLADNPMARKLIAKSFKNLDCGPAFFLRHADFLGALGCLSVSMEGWVRQNSS